MYDPDWAPSVADVGAIIRTRTKDANGNEPGTFTSATRPTDDDVAPLISTAVARISAKTGEIPDAVQDDARYVAALYAATLVELTFFPEQVSRGDSPYAQLKALLDEALTDLITASGESQDGGELGDADLSPLYGFPIPCAGAGSLEW